MVEHHHNPKDELYFDIAIFGGSFNPPHLGHVKIVDSLQKDFKFKKIIIVPAGIPSHKKALEFSAKERLTMLKNIFGKLVSDVEVKQKKKNYTVDTLEFFQKKYPKRTLWFVMGLDSFADFLTWKDYERILQLSSLLVFDRKGKTSKAKKVVQVLTKDNAIALRQYEGKLVFKTRFDTRIVFSSRKIPDQSSSAIRKALSTWL